MASFSSCRSTRASLAQLCSEASDPTSRAAFWGSYVSGCCYVLSELGPHPGTQGLLLDGSLQQPCLLGARATHIETTIDILLKSLKMGEVQTTQLGLVGSLLQGLIGDGADVDQTGLQLGRVECNRATNHCQPAELLPAPEPDRNGFRVGRDLHASICSTPRRGISSKTGSPSGRYDRYALRLGPTGSVCPESISLSVHVCPPPQPPMPRKRATFGRRPRHGGRRQPPEQPGHQLLLWAKLGKRSELKGCAALECPGPGGGS